jgi:transcription initiation factor IIE alpha subunit
MKCYLCTKKEKEYFVCDECASAECMACVELLKGFKCPHCKGFAFFILTYENSDEQKSERESLLLKLQKYLANENEPKKGNKECSPATPPAH